MKEISQYYEVNGVAAPLPPTMQPVRLKEAKRWLVAQSRVDKKYHRMQNASTELAYHAVINKVKELIIQSGGDTIFERDHKYAPFAYTGMHDFIASTFSWRLDCELDYNYEVYFTFHNCPYEAAIREMMKGYPLDRTTHERIIPHGYEAHYKAVLAIQSPIYITSLKGTG
jgi:hypothetical protein